MHTFMSQKGFEGDSRRRLLSHGNFYMIFYVIFLVKFPGLAWGIG